MNSKKSIKHWSDSDKPREKLLAQGVHRLTDAELLAIILGSGSKEKSAVELAREILANADNNLRELQKTNIQGLLSFNGVGEAKAVSVLAAFELGRRIELTEASQYTLVTSSQVAFDLVRKDLGIQEHEECWVLFLNRRNELIAKERMSSGGITGTVVDTRLILKRALEKLATGIILCHNHPSGNLKPSPSDLSITEKLNNASKHLDIKLLDHLIVTRSGFYSFADEGQLS